MCGGLGLKGKSVGGGIIILRAIRKNESAVGERLCGARPKKNWVGGRVGFFNLAKSGHEKKSPWAVCNLHGQCDTIARPLGRNIGIISNCLKKF